MIRALAGNDSYDHFGARGGGKSWGVLCYQAANSFPLDCDFFELLQKIDPASKDEPAVTELIQWILASDDGTWSSMERTFYTLYIRARMSEILFPQEKSEVSVARLLSSFTRAIDALLRVAHGKKSCAYHLELLRKMSATDGVITFNYDLVAERATRKLSSIPAFGNWVYGFDKRPNNAGKVPILYKLHGSVNRVYDEDEDSFTVRQKSWKDFDDEPGYRAHSNSLLFAIMLPYWDKKIEEPPWCQIWGQAAAHLQKTVRLIVWGYSLPLTDLKALELLKLSLGPGRSCLEDVCIIDPSVAVRTRWRVMFPGQRFWPYEGIEEFLDHPPAWW